MTVGGANTETESAPIPTEESISLWELMTSGGIGGAIIMGTLLLLSIIAVYIIVERYMAIKRAGKEDSNLMNQVKDHILDGKIEAAKTVCQSNESPVARMIEKGITLSLIHI